MNIESKQEPTSEAETLICAVQTRDPRTGRISYCIKPQGHHSPLYSEQVHAAEHRAHPTHDRAKEMTEALAEDARRNKEDMTMNIEITPEMIEALRTLRTLRGDGRYHVMSRQFRDAIDVLDNAGVFQEIDEATGYDIDSVCTCPPGIRRALHVHLTGCSGDRISKCTCPDTDYRKATGNHHAECSGDRISKCTCPELSRRTGVHLHGCPGDPAEWGDMAFTSPTA